MTALQTIEWENAQFDVDAAGTDAPPPDLHLTAAQAVAWERICDRVLARVGQADREEFPSYVGIITRDPRVCTEYAGDSRVIEDETDLVGVDSQTTAGLATEHVETAVGEYIGTRSSARRSIAESDEQRPTTADRQTRLPGRAAMRWWDALRSRATRGS